MSFRLAFRYISYRKLHDRKLPNVLARFTNRDPEYISTSSPRKADHCSKTILKSIDSETIDSETMFDAKKKFECCGENSSLTERCDMCPYDRYY
jgi:hypothetical protein